MTTAIATNATMPGTSGFPPVTLPSGASSFCSIASGLRELEAGLVPAGQEDHADEQDGHEDHLAPPGTDRSEGAALDLGLDLAEDHRPAQCQREAVEPSEHGAGRRTQEHEENHARAESGHRGEQDTAEPGQASGRAPDADGDPLDGDAHDLGGVD